MPECSSVRCPSFVVSLGVFEMISSERKQVEDQGIAVAGPVLERPLVWVVVVSKPGQEQRAKRELMQQGFDVYLPMRLFENRRGETCATPFLKGYLFARVPPAVSEWRSIFSTLGVAGVLGMSRDRAFGVKDAVVERLMAQEDAGYIRLGLQEDGVPVYSAGQKVDLDGCIEAMVQERVDARRVLILVSLFGRDSLHTVDIKRLAATAAQ